MKSLYLFTMFSVSTAMGIYYGYSVKQRIRTLEELINFFKYLVIKITAKDGSLLHCINTYMDSPNVEEFLSVLTEHLGCGCLRPFEPAAKALSVLSEAERGIVSQIDIGSLMYDEQIKSLENAILYLEDALKKANVEGKKTNVLSYSGALVGLALVIIFI